MVGGDRQASDKARRKKVYMYGGEMKGKWVQTAISFWTLIMQKAFTGFLKKSHTGAYILKWHLPLFKLSSH